MKTLSSHLFFPAIALSFVAAAPGQALDPAFATDYTLTTLPAIPGAPDYYGGLTINFVDPNSLLVICDTEELTAEIYAITVTRDSAGHINGYSGTATLHATAPNADGGLDYEPTTGTLFYSTYPNNSIGQIMLFSTSPDRIDPLGLAGTTGSLRFTPPGYPNAGKLRITTYDTNIWASADVSPDGFGTFDLNNVTQIALVPGCSGTESMIYVDPTYPGFNAQEVLVCNWDCDAVGAYSIDVNGDIDVTAPRREFLSGFTCSGAMLDPFTGDFIFSSYYPAIGGVPGLVIVSESSSVTLPGACGGAASATTIATSAPPSSGTTISIDCTAVSQVNGLVIQGFVIGLNQLGLPLASCGCIVHPTLDLIDVQIASWTSLAPESWSMPFAIPGGTAGITFYVQGFVAGTAASTCTEVGLPVNTTDALAVTIQ